MLSIPDLIKAASQSVRRINAADALKECADKDGLIIDVREPGEASAKPTRDTVNIPRGVLEFKISEACDDADWPIFTHCAGGGRATLAAEQLQRIGYKNVTAISSSVDEICALQE
jgi:phage shock protein E